MNVLTPPTLHVLLASRIFIQAAAALDSPAATSGSRTTAAWCDHTFTPRRRFSTFAAIVVGFHWYRLLTRKYARRLVSGTISFPLAVPAYRAIEPFPWNSRSNSCGEYSRT